MENPEKQEKMGTIHRTNRIQKSTTQIYSNITIDI